MLGERVDETPGVVVGVLHEARVDLHLTGQDGLQVVGHVVPRGDLLGAGGELGVGRDHPELLLARERLLAQRVPPGVELPLVLGRPLDRDVVGRVRRAGRVVDEERLVGHQRLLLADPVDRAIGHVLGEVVALLRGAVGLNRNRAVVDRRGVLVRLPADEAVEVLEAAAPGRPVLERSHRARLPHGHLVALAELGRRVAVELQRLGQRRRRVRAQGVVARRRRRDLGDPAHADRVVVAPGQQRLARRRAQRRGVEAVVAQPVRGQALEGRRLARAAEGRGGAEARVVEQDHEHVGRAGGRTQRLDRRIRGVGVLGVVGRQSDSRAVRDRQDVARAHPAILGSRGWDCLIPIG